MSETSDGGICLRGEITYREQTIFIDHRIVLPVGVDFNVQSGASVQTFPSLIETQCQRQVFCPEITFMREDMKHNFNVHVPLLTVDMVLADQSPEELYQLIRSLVPTAYQCASSGRTQDCR